MINRTRYQQYTPKADVIDFSLFKMRKIKKNLLITDQRWGQINNIINDYVEYRCEVSWRGMRVAFKRMNIKDAAWL